jgi:hypothetical protein
VLTLVGLAAAGAVGFVAYAVLTVVVFGTDNGHRTIFDDEID